MDPQFSQARSSNLLLPCLLALAILAATGYLLLRYTPHRTADLAITHTATLQAHTVFKSDTILVGRDKAEDNLYVLATLRVDDKLNLPLFLKDLTGTLTTADGQILTTNAAEKTDLAPLYVTFPALKNLASPPLLRDTAIQPGQSAEGMVLLQFPVTQDAWNHRQSAAITVDLYHQPSQTIAFPKP